MNDVFKKEWELYRKGGARPAFRGVEKRAWPKGFDSPVKVGDVRVFADMNRPFVALVAEDRGKVGFRIVPVSPFTVPASAREMLVGERVYQLWNACVAARSFVERSWRIETLAEEDAGEIAAAVAALPSGARSEDETAREYERAFAVSGGDFRDLTACAVRSETGLWRRRAGWSIAAMLMLCCGIGGLWYQDVRMSRREAEGMARTQINMAYDRKLRAENEPIELEATAQCEVPPPQVDVRVDMPQIANASCPNHRESDVRRAAERCKSKAACVDSVALIKSPVTMKSMCGSRTPGAVWGDPHVVRSPSSNERYATAEENEFLNPRSEPLSTFSLDVDTTSYALMRSYLTESKRLPPKDAVRIEEFVNYFKYDYPQPKGDEPIAVDCELAACPWNAKHQLLRLGVRAKSVDEATLPPCNLTFLVDVSGSMMGEDRIELVKKALKMLVGKLRDEDHVAIVTYANDTAVRLPSVSGREKRAIGEVIDGLVANGGTAGGDGIQRAYAEAQKNFDKTANNRVILVTDGDFNIGISSPRELEEFIATKRKSGVFLTVLGVGRGNYQDASMKKLANAGNGNYAYLDSLLEAKKVLLNEFGGTLMTVAKDVKVQIEFNPTEVEGYRLLGYENRLLKAQEFNDDKKDAGEIGAGHVMTAFYEIVPAGTDEKVGAVDPLKYQKSESMGKGELFTVKTRYKLPSAETSVLREQAHAAADMMRKEPSVDFRFASAVAEFALLLKDSKFKGEASYANLIERARNAKGVDREGLRAEFIRLAEAAELMSEGRARSPQKIGRMHVDGCYSDAPTENAVVTALRELKLSQADDGSWGTNKVTDTAWAVLAFLSHGELPSRSKEFGETVLKGIEFLIGAADSADDREIDLLAYAMIMARDMTRHPTVCGAAVGVLRRMGMQKDLDPLRQLLRTEACWLAQRSAGAGCGVGTVGEIAALADEMWPTLMAQWKAFAPKGEEIAFKCRALMLDGERSLSEALCLVDRMRAWKPDGKGTLSAAFCAALCKYDAGMRAGARQDDIATWIEWNRAMKQRLRVELANAKDVTEKALIVLQLTVCYRYRRPLPFSPQLPRKSLQEPEVKVDVDI